MFGAQPMKYLKDTRNARMNSPCFGMKKNAVGLFKVCRSHEDFASFRIHGFEPSSNLWVFLLKLRHHLIRLWVRIQDVPPKKQVVAKTVKDVRYCTWIDRRDFKSECIREIAYGGFLKWWYPQIIHFNRVFHYKPSILGYPYFWKHPYPKWSIQWYDECNIVCLSTV